MFKRFRQLIATGLAMLCCTMPMQAFAETIPMATDRNGDGIVDVFDFALMKQAIMQKCAPTTISLSDEIAPAGTTVTLTATITDNAGFNIFNVSMLYDEALTLSHPDPIMLEPQFTETIMPTAVVSKRLHRVTLLGESKHHYEENGAIFTISFEIPADAEVGTVYRVQLVDTNLALLQSNLPRFLHAGSITVCAPPETTTETTTTTTTTTTETTTTTTTTVTTTETTCPEETTTTVSTSTGLVIKNPGLGGIDISSWQDKVDFQALKNNPDVNYVILRAGYGRLLKQEDAKFKTYYQKAKAVGLPVGAYWYSYAMTPEDAVLEAEVCAQVLGNRTFEYPIAFDIEEPKQLKLGKEKVSAIIDAFCGAMEEKGYYVSIYCSSYYLNHTISDAVRNRYDIWVANYDVSEPSYKGKYGIWQYGLGKVAGIQGDVDLDFSYRDYPRIMQDAHRNGF